MGRRRRRFDCQVNNRNCEWEYCTFYRVKAAGYNYTRYPDTVARYTMHKHKHASDAGNGENECRWRLLEDAHNRWQSNGLNNLKYNVENMTFNKLYTHILVDLLEEESKADIPARVNCTQ